jgi:hypothetical protein
MVVNARAIDDSEAIKLGIAKKADTVDDVVRSVLGVATASKTMFIQVPGKSFYQYSLTPWSTQ